MRIIYISIIVVIFLISCNNAKDGIEKKLYESVAFKEQFVIGNDSLFLLHPRFIDLDRSGSIYVADEGRMEILKFSQDGTFLGSIGERGRGPGEIISIRGLYIDNEIIVFDRMQARISIFNLNGVLKSTINNVELSAQVSFEKKDSTYFLFYVDNIMNFEKAYLMHTYDSSFNKKNSFLPTREFNVNTEKYMGPIFASLLGNFLFLSDTELLYTPPVYNGNMFIFNYSTETPKDWNISKIIKGGLIFGSALEEYTNQAGRKPDIEVYISGESEPTKMLLNSSSKGLFKTKNSNIIHFTTLHTEEGKRLFGFEKYNSNLEYEGYYVLKETLSSEPFNWDVVNKDGKERFYIIDRTSDVLVRVISIDDI